MLKSDGGGEVLEAHRAVVGTVEERGGVAKWGKERGNRVGAIECVACHVEGFDEHGYGGEYGRHSVDAFATISIGALPGE